MDATSRVRAYEELFATVAASGTTLSAYLMPDLERARHTLGTSIAERVLPYVLEDSVRGVSRRALKELASLYVGRNRRVLGEEAYDAFLLGTEESTVPLRPAAYVPPGQLQNPAMRTAMSRAPRILTGLDCGVLASWWGSGGQGRELLVAWTSMLAQAAAEMASSKTGENTPYLLQWILLDCFQEGAAALAAYRIEESVRRELLVALLLGVHLSHHVVREQTLSSDSLVGLARGMAIYNAGDALSGEALTAYRKAVLKTTTLEERTIAVADLEPAIRQQFVFLQPRLRLVVGRGSDGRICEIFRYAGTVIFKGFEQDAPTEIWEMVNPDDQAGQMLSLSRTLV